MKKSEYYDITRRALMRYLRVALDEMYDVETPSTKYSPDDIITAIKAVDYEIDLIKRNPDLDFEV